MNKIIKYLEQAEKIMGDYFGVRPGFEAQIDGRMIEIAKLLQREEHAHNGYEVTYNRMFRNGEEVNLDEVEKEA